MTAAESTPVLTLKNENVPHVKYGFDFIAFVFDTRDTLLLEYFYANCNVLNWKLYGEKSKVTKMYSVQRESFDVCSRQKGSWTVWKNVSDLLTWKAIICGFHFSFLIYWLQLVKPTKMYSSLQFLDKLKMCWWKWQPPDNLSFLCRVIKCIFVDQCREDRHYNHHSHTSATGCTRGQVRSTLGKLECLWHIQSTVFKKAEF